VGRGPKIPGPIRKLGQGGPFSGGKLFKASRELGVWRGFSKKNPLSPKNNRFGKRLSRAGGELGEKF